MAVSRKSIPCSLVIAFAIPSALAAEATVQTSHHQVEVQTIAKGLEHPWGLALLPDGRFLVTERNSGQLRLGDAQGDLSAPIEGVPEIFRYKGETSRSQAGLFDVKLHPDFDDNQHVYLSYSKPTERGAAAAISRGRLVEDGHTARLADVETIFEMAEEDQDSSGLHFGGRMAFHPRDNTLFLTIGERRNISRSQDRGDQAGSILRLTDEGGVPDDNPFVGEDDAAEAVYSWGHRNPQGLAFDPDTGELWSNEHGPKGGDELNLIESGRNYGWPYITHGVDYSGAPLGVGTTHEGMESATYVFEGTVAPSGLAFYHGEMFSEWQGDILNGGLASEGIVRVRIQNGQVSESEKIPLDRRIRDVQVAEDGSVWLITEYEDGEVLRLIAAD